MTELQMQQRDARTECARQRLLNSLDGMPVVLIEGGEQAVHVVESYKHLGGVAADGGRLRKEIAARLVSASAALKKPRRPLHNKQLSWEVKLQFVKSLVASRLFFGAATWPELDRWCMNKLRSFWMKVLRQATGHSWSDARARKEKYLSDQELL